MKHPPVDAVVIGAGIVGAACAEALTRAGLSVAIVEPHVVGGGTSAAGMGHILVLDDSDARFALTSYSRRLWLERAAELPAKADFARIGTVWIAADGEDYAAAKAKHEFAQKRGFRTELLDARRLYELEPNLRPGLLGGLRVLDDAIVYTPLAARWLVDEACRAGATLLSGASAAEIRDGSLLLADGSELPAGVIVNAAGTAASALTPEVPVAPKKGHLVVTEPRPGFLHHELIELAYLKSAHSAAGDSVAFNLQPRPNGQILIGSCRQPGKSGAAIEHAILSRMVRRALDYMPRLAPVQALRVWTGLRPATPDNVPVIGPHPRRRGLYFATGHEGMGISASLGTGQLLADSIQGRETAIPIEPYLPDRFFTEASND